MHNKATQQAVAVVTFQDFGGALQSVHSLDNKLLNQQGQPIRVQLITKGQSGNSQQNANAGIYKTDDKSQKDLLNLMAYPQLAVLTG